MYPNSKLKVRAYKNELFDHNQIQRIIILIEETIENYFWVHHSEVFISL